MAPLLRCHRSRDGSPASHASPASPLRLAFRCPTSRRTVRPRWSSGSWDHWRSRPTTSRSRRAVEATGIARASTVFNYARRGRGKRGDTWPYAVQREIEDIEALVAEGGGSGRAHGSTPSASKSGAEFFRHQTGCPRATASTRPPRLSGSDSQES
jgi:hypothetical protein